MNVFEKLQIIKMYIIELQKKCNGERPLNK